VVPPWQSRALQTTATHENAATRYISTGCAWTKPFATMVVVSFSTWGKFWWCTQVVVWLDRDTKNRLDLGLDQSPRLFIWTMYFNNAGTLDMILSKRCESPVGLQNDRSTSIKDTIALIPPRKNEWRFETRIGRLTTKRRNKDVPRWWKHHTTALMLSCRRPSLFLAALKSR
jgi:hypothetical protein